VKIPAFAGQQKKQQIFSDLLLHVPLLWAAGIQFFMGSGRQYY